MKRQSILVLVIPVLLFLNESMGDVVIIYPSDDAVVDSNVPDDNFGSTTYLWVGHGIPDDGVRRSYLKFNLSSIPANKMVISASLRLDPGYVSIPAPQVGAHYLTSDAWGEMTITWNNAPTGFNSTATDTVTVNITESFWTITEDVDGAYRGDGTYSVVMKLSDEASNTATSCSSSGAVVSDWWPYVEVEYGDQKYSGGNGSAENPYLISTAADMNEIGAHPEDWDKHFVMVNDINLTDYTGTQFNIIGSSYPEVFAGVFDGNGHCILNFTYETNTGNNIGLFGYTYGLNCEIRNLSFENPNVSALTSDNVGALVGYNYARISDCRVTGGIIKASHNVGGLVGTSQGDLFRCHGNALVIGDSYVGGLIGQFVFASIYDSYSEGTCIGDDTIGGLAGFVNGPEMSNCYSVAVVDGNTAVGSLAGQSHGTAYHECFFDELVNPDVNAVGEWLGQDPNVHAKNTVQMQQRSTFTEAGWNFVEIWDIGENQTYPYLRVYPAGDLNHDGRVDFFDFAIVAFHWLEGTES